MKFGMLGTGGQAVLHAKAIASIEGAELVAVTSGHPETGEAFARSHGAVSFLNLAALLRDGEIDAVVIASPTHLHADQACDALAAGKHVFCEAPSAWTLADMDRMLRNIVGEGYRTAAE